MWMITSAAAQTWRMRSPTWTSLPLPLLLPLPLPLLLVGAAVAVAGSAEAWLLAPPVSPVCRVLATATPSISWRRPHPPSTSPPSSLADPAALSMSLARAARSSLVGWLTRAWLGYPVHKGRHTHGHTPHCLFLPSILHAVPHTLPHIHTLSLTQVHQGETGGGCHGTHEPSAGEAVRI